jgi:hypothetical protein
VRSIADRVRSGVRECAGHPAVLAYAIGNEISASIVCWHGRRRVEKFLEELFRVAIEEDPDTLVTYVNYPSTEYLQLPFLDLVCFNVFLEAEEEFEAYLARLQTLAGNRPLSSPSWGSTDFETATRRRPIRSPGSCRRLSPRAAPAPSSSRGRTSGTAAAPTSTTGVSV